MYRIVNTGLAIILLFSIASAQDTLIQQYEKFDPLTLNEPFLPVANGAMIDEIFTEINPGAYSQRDSISFIEQMGWKVQVMSIKDGVRADSVLQKMKDTFGERNAQLIWNPPYWKIRVGNCATRYKAEQMLGDVKRMGYDRAWIIRATIRIQEKQLPY
ncbi:MAG TPA: SPOR domain-containing protein [bacterium]|nr:SPOR domain-containing protein [bacterium]